MNTNRTKKVGMNVKVKMNIFEEGMKGYTSGNDLLDQKMERTRATNDYE